MAARPKPEAERVDDVIRSITQSLQALDSVTSGAPKLFPHGITKINVSATIKGVVLSIDIEGPQSGESRDNLSNELRPDKSADVVFTITERVGPKARGSLQWPAQGPSSPAVSGDSGHDAIDVRMWSGITFQERAGDAPDCDPKANCWFSVFKDAYGRTGIGIHPDGGVPDATLGCIGIRDADTSAWHDALKNVAGVITCEVKESKSVQYHSEDGVFEKAAAR